MYTAWFTFASALLGFLPRAERHPRIRVEFQGRQSVKHLVEALGIPHTEAGTIRVNGLPASLEQIACDDDEVTVEQAAGHPPLQTRFILDGHLGRLAAYLRMLGFDTSYRNEFPDEEIVKSTIEEDRILLTRDRRLLMRKVIRYGYCLRSLDPASQLREVLARFDLVGQILPFHRCIRCNGVLETVDKQEILGRLKPLTARYFSDFHRCRDCAQVYWKGSHYEKMIRFIDGLGPRGSAAASRATFELE